MVAKDLKKHRSKIEKRNLLFYIAFIAWPSIQFLIFYVGVNFNSFLLSFQTYDSKKATYYFGDIFKNFKRLFKNFETQALFKNMLINSFFAFFAHVFFGLTLGVLVAYFIYKKGKLHKFFKIMIMMPCFISSLIFVSIFINIVDRALPSVVFSINGKKILGLISNIKTSFWTIMLYGVWFGAGGSMLIYLNAMENIPDSIVDAAKMDGCTYFQELIHITLPQIWQTFVVFFSVSIASYFTNAMGLFAFWGKNADPSIQTFGYFFYVSTLEAGYSDYPYLSSMGLLFTSIAVPVTLLIRNLMLKKGPTS